MLRPYRVLDLANEKGLLCGKILGDLGADVIKVERPGGDASRNIGPFYMGIPDPQKSLYWFAFNTNKRGITLAIETSDGCEIFKELVRTADLVIETFTSGYLDSIGLGYSVLSSINPGIIMASITPFGQSGPFREYKVADIVAMALGGLTYMSGDPDRPPLRIAVPQSYLHAGAWAAAASLIALYYRNATGEGQHIDVSLHEAATWSCYAAQEWWSYARKNVRRQGWWRELGPKFKIQRLFPCKDGYVSFTIFGGSGAAPGQNWLLQWMDLEGMCPSSLKGFNFNEWDYLGATQDFISTMCEAFANFFKTKTKDELFKAAMEKVIFLAPLYDASDLLKEPQLRHRNFWVEVEHPELSQSLVYPGPFAEISEMPIDMKGRAPLIGEHNREVYGELGLSPDELIILKGTGVI